MESWKWDSIAAGRGRVKTWGEEGSTYHATSKPTPPFVRDHYPSLLFLSVAAAAEVACHEPLAHLVIHLRHLQLGHSLRSCSTQQKIYRDIRVSGRCRGATSRAGGGVTQLIVPSL